MPNNKERQNGKPNYVHFKSKDKIKTGYTNKWVLLIEIMPLFPS